MPWSSTLHQVVEGEQVVHDRAGRGRCRSRGCSRAPRSRSLVPIRLIISAAVLTPPSGALRACSPPASMRPITSFRSFSAEGWMPSSVAMRTSTSLRCRSAKVFSTADGLVGVEVDQHRGDDLRMLVAQHLADRRRRPSTSGLRCRRCRRSAGCGRSAGWPCPRRAPSSARCARSRRCRRRAALRLDGRLVNFASTLVEAVLGHRGHARDRLAQALHFARREMA